MNELLILTLLNIPKVSRKTVNSLLETINNMIEINGGIPIDDREIIEVFQQGSLNNRRIIIPKLDSIKLAKEKAESIILKSKAEKINSITILDNDFPNKVKNIDDPPVILFYKGNKECLLADKTIAVIGTREPTVLGKDKAEQLGNLFAKEGFIITSGLAKGCDELGHKGCIDAKGKSIAILPGGLDKIYPSSNKNLAESILKYEGCLVSEYVVGSRPFRSSFIERDRLQSAFSEGVIVVETDVVGGTMHTVEFTLKQKRILACYKHPKKYWNEKKTHGNIKLINEGKAIGLYTKNDIEEFKQLILKRINEKNKFNMLEKGEIGIQTKLI